MFVGVRRFCSGDGLCPSLSLWMLCIWFKIQYFGASPEGSSSKKTFKKGRLARNARDGLSFGVTPPSTWYQHQSLRHLLEPQAVELGILGVFLQ